MAERDDISEPLKLKGSEDKWTELDSKRFGLLSTVYQADPDQLDTADTRELLKLTMKKEVILAAEKEKAKKARSKKSRRSKGREAKSKSARSERSSKKTTGKGDESSDASDSESTESSGDSTESSESRSDASGSDTDDPGAKTSSSRPKSKKHTRARGRQASESEEEGEMQQVKKKIQEMVDQRFFSLIDEDQSRAQFGQISAPKTGSARELSSKLEKDTKGYGKTMYFGDRNDRSHPLRYLLGEHRRVSNKGKLTSKASIRLLLRLLRGQAFSMASALQESKADIELIYESIQKAFPDTLNSDQASRALEAFVESPNVIQLTKVSAKILEWASLVHGMESKKTRAQSTNVTAENHLTHYLQKYFPRPEVTRIKQQHLRWRCRNPNLKNPLESFFQLSQMAQTTLEGMMPSYAKALAGRGQGPAPPGRSPYQTQRLQEVLEEIDWEQETGLKSHLSEKEMVEREQEDWELDSVLAAEEGARGVTYDCLLCGQTQHGERPGLWRFCTIYPGVTPVKFAQPCCRRRHPPMAVCRTPREHRREVKSQEKPSERVQVYS